MVKPGDMDYYNVILVYESAVVTVTVRTLKGGSYEDWYLLREAVAVLRNPGNPHAPFSQRDDDRVREFSGYFVRKLKGRGEIKGVSVGNDHVYRKKEKRKVGKK